MDPTHRHHRHAEYFRGIRNPIGLKIGPGMSGDELVATCKVLNAANEPGKLTLITRYRGMVK
jgi:3-deoxy-7-phosphoheptulonate synthase